MGKRGPKKKIGSVPLESGRPVMPSGLSAAAKRAWVSICDDLEAQGTLVKTDRKIVELYARTYALFLRTEDQLAEEALSLGSEGRKFVNPLANLYTTLEGRLHRILLDCGLSPTTRKTAPNLGKNPYKDITDGEL